MQTEAPELATNLPARQTTQLDAPAPPEKLPATQGLQAEADVAEYEPAPHAAQTLDVEAPMMFEDVPAAHSKHAADPVSV